MERKAGFYWCRFGEVWRVLEWVTDNLCPPYFAETGETHEAFPDEIDETPIVRVSGIQDLTRPMGLQTPKNFFDSTH